MEVDHPEPLMPVDRRTLIAQGAEARVWECTFLGRPAVVKQRFNKKYRHPELDAKLTPARLKQEVRSMLRARKLGVRTPALYHVEPAAGCIYMQKVHGGSLKQALHSGLLQGKALQQVLAELGRVVALLHDAGIVHGDLTTSNFMLVPLPTSSLAPAAAAAVATTMAAEGTAVDEMAAAEAVAPAATAAAATGGGGGAAAAAAGDASAAGAAAGGDLYVIDFGLSYNSTIPEDKAVDLYVLERAFVSTHAAQEGLFDQVLTSYRRTSKQWSATLNRFADVRQRGRKRAMVG